MSAARRFQTGDPIPGRRVGSYKLERRLGVGGMGEVWLGRHAESDGLGAVKLAKRDGEPSRRRAFVVREGHAVTRLRHPHIVGLFEVGDDFVVYQYVEGQDLQRRLQSPIDPASAVRITRQVAAALAHAHQRGVVHRDVKPSNILLDTQGNAFLTDFGLAIVGGDAIAGTARAGTPGYMAPEQQRGEPVGAAADQYALGRTLLEMLLGGTPPAEGDSALAQLPEPVPGELREVLARATAADAARRFPDMDAFETALEGLDLSSLAPPVQLAPQLRSPAPFAWAAAGQVETLAPGLARSSLHLRGLLDAGLVPDEPARTLLTRHGYRDLAWTTYGSSARLGSLVTPEAFTRASEVIVLLHGFPMTREVWKPIACALCRDNARALVIALDVLGAGGSPFQAPDGGEHVQLGRVPDLARDLMALLGLGRVPTVLVGHSFSASGLLEKSDEELGATTSRVALNPAFPQFSPGYRRRMERNLTILKTLLFVPPLHPLGARLVSRFSTNELDLSAEAKAGMRDVTVAMGVPLVKRFVEALLATRIKVGGSHERLTIIAGQNDPLVAEDVLQQALRALDLPPSACVRMATGGHYPHLESEQHPEWTARNQAEIVHIIGAALAVTVMSPESSGAAAVLPSGEG